MLKSLRQNINIADAFVRVARARAVRETVLKMINAEPGGLLILPVSGYKEE